MKAGQSAAKEFGRTIGAAHDGQTVLRGRVRCWKAMLQNAKTSAYYRDMQ